MCVLFSFARCLYPRDVLYMETRIQSKHRAKPLRVKGFNPPTCCKPDTMNQPSSREKNLGALHKESQRSALNPV